MVNLLYMNKNHPALWFKTDFWNSNLKKFSNFKMLVICLYLREKSVAAATIWKSHPTSRPPRWVQAIDLGCWYRHLLAMEKNVYGNSMFTKTRSVWGVAYTLVQLVGKNFYSFFMKGTLTLFIIHRLQCCGRTQDTLLSILWRRKHEKTMSSA